MSFNGFIPFIRMRVQVDNFAFIVPGSNLYRRKVQVRAAKAEAAILPLTKFEGGGPRLINVTEVDILPIREIGKSSRIRVGDRLLSKLCSNLIPPPILPDEHKAEASKDDEFDAVCDQHRTDTKRVCRSLFRTEEEGTNNVTTASSHPDDSARELLFGLTTDIGGDER